MNPTTISSLKSSSGVGGLSSILQAIDNESLREEKRLNKLANEIKK